MEAHFLIAFLRFVFTFVYFHFIYIQFCDFHLFFISSFFIIYVVRRGVRLKCKYLPMRQFRSTRICEVRLLLIESTSLQQVYMKFWAGFNAPSVGD